MPSQPHTGSSSTPAQPSGIGVHTGSSKRSVPQLFTAQSQYSPASHASHPLAPVSVSVSLVPMLVVSSVVDIVGSVDALVDAEVDDEVMSVVALVVMTVVAEVDAVVDVASVVSLPAASSSESSDTGQPSASTHSGIATQ